MVVEQVSSSNLSCMRVRGDQGSANTSETTLPDSPCISCIITVEGVSVYYNHFIAS